MSRRRLKRELEPIRVRVDRIIRRTKKAVLVSFFYTEFWIPLGFVGDAVKNVKDGTRCVHLDIPNYILHENGLSSWVWESKHLEQKRSEKIAIELLSHSRSSDS